MPGPVPGIHVLTASRQKKGVDGRDKPGHDEVRDASRSTRPYIRYFDGGTRPLSFSASLMLSLKPPGITMSPGF